MGAKPRSKTSLYFDVPPRFARLNESRFVILPAPYERTTSYLKGCAKGPQAILEASAQVELLEPDIGVEPYLCGIHTTPAVRFGKGDEVTELDRIRKAAEPFVDSGKFLITLGGEHTVTAPLVKLFAEKFRNFSVLHIDAHPDLRDSYQGSSYSHACVARRVIEHAPMVQVGVRSWCIEQDAFMKKAVRKKIAGRPMLRVFPAWDIVGRRGWQRKAVESLSENVYLTFDLDGLDPSVIPAVGTPEPGGLGWYEIINLLKLVIQRRNLVGMDMVELKPIPGQVQSDMAAARLLHHIIAYQVRRLKPKC